MAIGGIDSLVLELDPSIAVVIIPIYIFER